jgi:predicted transport protein
MDKKTEETMAANLLKNTGRSLAEWIDLAKTNQKGKHGETVKWLKETYNLGLFFADLIVHKANGTDAGSFSDDELVELQYKGKEHLKVIYNKLIAGILAFGDNDIEIVPKKGYVSLRTRKQFACLKPATKTRFEVELILKGQEAVGILEGITGAGAMCTHKIKIEQEAELTPEVMEWIQLAYQKSR